MGRKRRWYYREWLVDAERGAVMTHLSTCGVVYAMFCRDSDGGESGAPSRWHNR